MKKLILAAMIASVAGIGVQTARANDHGWCVAGQVLTGLAAAAVVTSAIVNPPVCSSVSVYAGPAPAYGVSYSYYQPAPPPPVVYVQAPPPPTVIYRAPVCYAPAPVYRPVAPICDAPRVGHGARFGRGYGHSYHGYR